jgi:hypothetical protein
MILLSLFFECVLTFGYFRVVEGGVCGISKNTTHSHIQLATCHTVLGLYRTRNTDIQLVYNTDKLNLYIILFKN